VTGSTTGASVCFVVSAGFVVATVLSVVLHPENNVSTRMKTRDSEDNFFIIRLSFLLIIFYN
jgi:hypothetical protein